MSIIFHLFQNNYLADIVALWNAAAKDCYGFYPLTPEILRRHVLEYAEFSPERLIVASRGREPLGFLLYDVVDVCPYPRAGVIAALAVHPDYWGQGIAQKLLQEALARLRRQRVQVIDALGAWPYSSYGVGLIDGSERAGPDLRNGAALWLFEKAGFKRERESLIMRAKIPEFPRPAANENSPQNSNAKTPGGLVVPPGGIDFSRTEENFSSDGFAPALTPRPAEELVYCQTRDGKQTWLDRCFRHWQAFDHVLLNAQGQTLTNAIFARMDGFCETAGREIYAVYGVNTPERFQRLGYAERNFAQMRRRLASLGGQEMEIHVYADNRPAVGLYEKCGFYTVGRNVIMRLR